ncbi:MAG: type II toxin-antitoxin system RelE/ParE family toxin [Proteobacteria bacterium]|nr:type II toxin-antitoxin system RelE/ParE family toxin [Pseudomonadota bacterium]MBU1547888.1 type II toxin-antitoxin system RelE/ParE family toxin [Pseudomonadota bacterium]MBU2618452.1 type II toxin-antitoxin system RelE/ParE family toxin [Pseudomonadota bacterium]
MYEIQWKAKAMKQLARIRSQETRDAIYASVQSLQGFPEVLQVKKLKNHEHSYRLRVGRYRVFFEADGEVRIIRIEEVKKRDDRTY